MKAQIWISLHCDKHAKRACKRSEKLLPKSNRQAPPKGKGKTKNTDAFWANWQWCLGRSGDRQSFGVQAFPTLILYSRKTRLGPGTGNFSIRISPVQVQYLLSAYQDFSILKVIRTSSPIEPSGPRTQGQKFGTEVDDMEYSSLRTVTFASPNQRRRSTERLFPHTHDVFCAIPIDLDYIPNASLHTEHVYNSSKS